MPKNKRKSDSENAVGEQNGRSKSKRGKGLKTGFATLTICAAAFGAYYSPHFRAASSDWLERGRALVAKLLSSDFFSKANDATEDEKMGEILAQAPSFRDFLTDEYGEEGARELLGIDAPEPIAAEAENADLAVAASDGWRNAEARTGVATTFPSAEPSANFADYVAAESGTSESLDAQELENGVDALLNSPISGSGLSFADYVAAETNATEGSAPQEIANVDAASTETRETTASESVEPQTVANGASAPESSFAENAAAQPAVDFEPDGLTANEEKTQFTNVAPNEMNEDEAALAARLEAEMKERGVGNPRIERWGERFWRASGFATTDDGVATFCEAVDVDPTAAQRAALAKFDAASF